MFLPILRLCLRLGVIGKSILALRKESLNKSFAALSRPRRICSEIPKEPAQCLKKGLAVFPCIKKRQ
jgi:hypothetical protein